MNVVQNGKPADVAETSPKQAIDKDATIAMQASARLEPAPSAPPRVLREGLPARPELLADDEWLKEHAEEYRGQWVALRNGELVAAAATARELRSRIEGDRGLHITRLF